MNFLRALPCLVLCGALNAQVIDLKPHGGGELKIGGNLFRFELTDLSSAPPKGGLPGAVKLEGNLVPVNAAQSFHMILTVLKDGSLYMLRIDRKTSSAYPDGWAATQKTRTHALRLEDRPGGRVELRCEGLLTGVIAKRPQNTTWSGTVWAIFPGNAGENLN